MGGAGEEFQRRITRQLLDALDGTGFALAGAGAIRAHGLTDRPTHDVDLFTQPLITGETFRAAVLRASAALRDVGHEVTPVQERHVLTVARLRHRWAGARCGLRGQLASRPTVQMSFGPVLSERDAVAGSCRRSTPEEMSETSSTWMPSAPLAGTATTNSSPRYREHDAGFDRVMFAAQLSRAVHFDAEEAEEYGIPAEEVIAMQQRTTLWAVRLRDEHPPGHRPGPPRRPRPSGPHDLWDFISDPSRRLPGGPDHGRSF